MEMDEERQLSSTSKALAVYLQDSSNETPLLSFHDLERRLAEANHGRAAEG